MIKEKDIRVTVADLRVVVDDRGTVFEPLDDVELSFQKNAHVVVTRPGVVRGNHRHRRTTEMIEVMGPALVRYRIGAAVEDVTVPAGKVYRFTFPPGVPHANQHTGETDGILVAFTTETHDPDAPDTVADPLIPV